ncbi:hypothetical protein TCAL_03119 [Tigriopus californicus]|uniref:Uncharacterized protein n=1 Tax=Tigriopus californicus TaxID=6832 RepID=A0A553P4H5_TIGCA|nr:uncharacterized protein LOC131884140 [Tigriopus californicus]TRY72589.1 hypothetical protein TCAL_03119 [Tigriopus californicus]|eukprot:TCALIF_03119-PA protein Name:"Protein of unknown function" AED:0.00 eAED:0.00 QI:29/1/1/1/1/1/2/36/188
MKAFACVLFLTTLVWAQNIEVPTDSCMWRGAKYGQMNACEPNEIVVGSCGSGRRDDCDSGQWHQLLCCKMPEYTYENCLEYKGEHGQDISCSQQAHDDSMLLQGACGSGLQHDCGGTTHIAKCCHGHLADAKLKSTGTCYWIYGYHGEKIQCNRRDEAAFGRCGSGYKDDCGTEKWHGLQCCQLTTAA